MAACYTIREMRQRVGSVLGITAWLEVEQTMMDEFARSTKDPDRLHVNPEWAATETPYGGTIAFGFWTLSLLTHFSHEIGMWPVDVEYALNYGLDRVRWISPVKVGARIRMRSTLAELEDREEGLLIRTDNLIEIQGEPRPALSAQWLGLFVHDQGKTGPAPPGSDCPSRS